MVRRRRGIPRARGPVHVVSVAGALFAIAGIRGLARAGPPILPVGALGLAVFAAVGPWLLNQWIRGDFERYAWVIHQGYPCSQMGGGPGTLWVFGTSWLAALGAFAYAAQYGLSSGRVAAGLGLGGALLAGTAAAMFVEPAVFARVLGCL
jgi:hypothetical protein